MSTTTINGSLILDQTTGIQDDDVAIAVDGLGDISGGLNAAFLAHLNGLTLSSSQLAFADRVEAASQAGLVTVQPGTGETIALLEFADLNNVQVFLDDGITPMTTRDGDELFMFTVAGGSGVEVRTALGDVVAVFWIVPNGDNTSATVQSITFEALQHDDPNNPDDSIDFSDALKVRVLTETQTGIGDGVIVDDDAPAITVPSSAPDAANAIEVGNAVGQDATGDIGWDVGSDTNDYANGDSDFVNGVSLSGNVVGGGALTDVQVTAGAEDGSSAVFNWSAHYDSDPITGGVQDATVGGTLTFDKDNDTFTVAVTDEAEGFSFSVLHTSELLAKAPTGNTGHPELVVSKLDDDFFVQFSANSTTQQTGFITNADGSDAQVGNQSWAAGEFLANSHIDWVSATQNTNGVAGDTIQKGELLTLRFFGEDILTDVNPQLPGGGTEKLDPTTTAGGVAIKFDGIGNSEDLIVVLNLIDANGIETTKSIVVQNSDLIKGTVPAPYNTEFTLDNNDALLVIESNDYNAAGETFEIQGVQIMQSGNGISGTGINLNGGVGDTGGSTGTQAWDPQDNDVLKIVDIGFIQTEEGTQDIALDFSFAINDGDGDSTTTQHINALVSSDFVV